MGPTGYPIVTQTNMDIKSLCTPTFTATELALARASTQARTPRLVQAAAKATKTIEPVARTELWRDFYAGALRDGHHDPEKFADSAVRSREMALKQRSKRHHTVVLKDAPKPPNEAASAAKGKSAPKAHGPRCRALTLEGRQCGFAATCGCFCKKHAPKEPPRPSFRLVGDAGRFTNTRLQGFLNAKPTLVHKVLGKPNGLPNDIIEAEWKLVFDDGVPATLFYSRSDPSLHVCGEDVGVIGRIRQLLAL
jgi:hypothetical protein